MVQLKLKVANAVGLHARPAAILAEETNRYESEIQVCNLTTNSVWVDAKSILNLLTLGGEEGHEIGFTIIGPDEEQASTSIQTLIETGFSSKL
jgi:phosphotransferase system HPr (HPr) family protein